MPYTEEELLNKMGELPEDLKDAIFSVETSETLAEIGKKYSLHVDKVGELVNETGLVMVGITHPKAFIPHLMERLGVDKLTARNVAEDVNKQIFQKVRESLKKIHGLAETPTPEGVGAPTPPKSDVGKAGPKAAAIPPAPKPELKPLEIRPGPIVTPLRPPPATPPAVSTTTPTPAAALPVKISQPLETKPAQPLNRSTTQPPPGLAFEEKTKESIFRTPSETREKIEEKSADSIKEKSFADIKKEMGEAKMDPYREAIE